MTTTETLPQVIHPAPVSTEQQKAWLGMAQTKNVLAATLGSMELQAQSILLKVKDSQDYKLIDESLAAYRKLNSDIIETRKPFTNAVDAGIVQPLMAFEKRVKDAPDYSSLVTRSLALRKAETEKASAANKKNEEAARFKAHVENEFFRVAAEYRQLLRRNITGQYEIALREKLSSDTSDIKKMMATLVPPPLAKFNTVILSGEEMMKIYEALPKPDYAGMYQDAAKELDETFANFDSDIKNAEQAIANQVQASQLADIAEQTKLQEDVAINTLIATAETVIVETPKIKKTVQVTIIESEQWAKTVMGAFIVNLPQLGKYIKVKSWAKLSIGQMAEYLGKLASDTGITFINLNLQEVEK